MKRTQKLVTWGIVILVPADDGAAAPVSGQFQKLRIKPGGENAGVAPDAAVGHGGDLSRILGPKGGQGFGTVPLQPGLVGHQKEHAVAVQQLFQPQADAAAQPQTGLVVGNGGEAVFPGQSQDLRILAHHHGHKAAGDGFQRPVDQGFPVDLRLQLVGAEPAGVSRRQDHTSDFQSDHLISCEV